MSLYQVQKLLYNLNRDEQFKAQYTNDKVTLLGSYDLTDQEREALSLLAPDEGGGGWGGVHPRYPQCRTLPQPVSSRGGIFSETKRL